MPPRLQLYTGRSLALRSKPCPSARSVAPLQRRCASDKSRDLPVAEKPKGPNQDQLPHVSEEAAQTGQTMGETTPDIEEHGTPVKEVCTVRAAVSCANVLIMIYADFGTRRRRQREHA